MEIVRTAANPWGQEVWIGIGWDLMWLALILGALFMVGHAVWMRSRRGESPAAPPDPGVATGIPERVTRHGGPARAFHWLMSLSMFALLITAFFPVAGIQFPWVTIHWIAGVALAVLVAWHVLDSSIRRDFWSMWIGREDVAEAVAELKGIFSRSEEGGERAGKYPIDHKMYHHGMVAVGLGVIVTGLLMMVRIDTPLLPLNPYLLGDGTWGVVYVLHGLCGVALITMIMAHVYFAVRPEKWWLTRSMIKGWITRTEFLSHFDPEKWKVTDAPADAPTPGAGSGAPAGVTPTDHPTA
jgi:cytochrome b subunit of formate dehydrogenase